MRCAGLNKYQLKCYENSQWFCSNWKKCFPYHGIDNDEFIHAIFSPNYSQNDSFVFAKSREFDNLMLGIGEDNDLDNNLSSEHLMNMLNFNCKYYGEEEVNNVIVENTGVSIIILMPEAYKKL